MSRGQRLPFQVATWTLFATAAAHLAGHLAGPQAPANDTEKTLVTLMSTYRYEIMGWQRTIDDFMQGFSLSYTVFMATMAGLGLVALKKMDAAGLRAFALVAALSTLAMLVLCVRYFVLPPTIFTAVALLGYALSAWNGRAR
jgi:hypothetical protein